jgi:hypothetical protein
LAHAEVGHDERGHGWRVKTVKLLLFVRRKKFSRAMKNGNELVASEKYFNRPANIVWCTALIGG